MSNLEDRLTSLERQQRRTRFAVGVVLGMLVFACTAAAAPRLVDLACKNLIVKSADGTKTVVELSDSGDIRAEGKITAKDVDILNELAALKKKVASEPRIILGGVDDLDNLPLKSRVSIPNKSFKVERLNQGTVQITFQPAFKEIPVVLVSQTLAFGKKVVPGGIAMNTAFVREVHKTHAIVSLGCPSKPNPPLDCSLADRPFCFVVFGK